MTSLKKPLSVIMAIMLILSFVAVSPVCAFAADEEKVSPKEIELNKKTEDGFVYYETEKGGELVLVGYVGSDKEVVVPSSISNTTVIAVGDGCFEGNTTVESIKLNSNITVIGDAAFKGCTALKELKGFSAITSFGESVFEGCTALESFEIPDTVTAIPSKAFSGCTALAEIKEHKNIKTVASDAFENTAWENGKEDGALNFGRVLYGVKGKVQDIVVGKGIEIIESYVFIGCDYIKSVVFGEDVSEIGLYAFQNCRNIETLTFGSAVGVIEAGAFKGCSSLKSIDFSETTLAAIGYEAFMDCTSLESAALSETLSTIGDYAFANTKIKTVEYGKNVETVGSSTYFGDDALESFAVVEKNKTFSAADGVLFTKNGKAIVNFPAAKTGAYEVPEKVEEIRPSAFINAKIETVTFAGESALKNIGKKAFENSAIKSFVLPAGVAKINEETFKNCEKLASFTFNDAVTDIGVSAFENCEALSEVKLPASVRNISTAAFKNAGLKTLDIGEGTSKIAASAFEGNGSLSKLALGSNLKTMGEKVFADCKALKAVELPAELVDFEANAFEGCSSLKKIAVAADSSAFKAVDNAVYNADGTKLVFAGTSELAALTIKDGTKTIGKDAFVLAKSVSLVTFPESVENVEASALDVTGWYQLQSSGLVYVGSVLYKVKGYSSTYSVKEGTVAIADGAFKNSSVNTVVLPASLEKIGKEAFAGAELTSLNVPSNVKSIGDRAFAGNGSMKSAVLSETLDTLGKAAFKGCTSLGQISVPASVKTLNTDTFAGCKSLEAVELNGVEEIKEYAFADCSALKAIKFPATLENISALSFIGCTALTSIDVADGNEKYKSEDGVLVTFSDEESKEFDTIALCPAGIKGEYTVPETIRNIGARAFYDCDALTSIIFSKNLKDIGDEAFFDCDSIKSVDIPENGKQKIGSYAFASCDELREFSVNSNLTDYSDNAFDGCNYFNYDSVTINVDDNSGLLLAGIVLVFVIIGVIWYLVYKKKQKKAEKAEKAKS